MCTILLNKDLLSTSYVPSTMLSTEYQDKQVVVPTHVEFILLYHALYLVLSIQIMWLFVKTRDSHPHPTSPLD